MNCLGLWATPDGWKEVARTKNGTARRICRFFNFQTTVGQHFEHLAAKKIGARLEDFRRRDLNRLVRVVEGVIQIKLVYWFKGSARRDGDGWRRYRLMAKWPVFSGW